MFRAVPLLMAALFTWGLADAGTSARPEITDPIDAEIEWLDIRKVWVEHQPFDVPRIVMQLQDYVPLPPDLRTGGLFNGPYYRVDFDLVDWNGTRIGNRDDQHVSVSIEETMIITYVCVWDEHDSACEGGFGCCYNETATIHGDQITWDVDFKTPLADEWAVGSGYRLENLRASATLRAMRQPTQSDLAPDRGATKSLSPPTLYANVRTPSDAALSDEAASGEIAAGAFIVAAILLAVGRFAYKAGRFRLLRWLLLGLLYSRITRNEVLQNERRSVLHDLIRQNPGITFGRLRRMLGVTSGPLVHHLSVLDKQGLIRCVRDGFRSRFYVRGARVREPYLSHTQRALLDAVEASPGIAQNQLAKILGLPRQSIRYHAQQLSRKGKIEVVREGKAARHFCRG